MNVIWHTINSKHLLAFVLNNTCNVLIKFIFPLFRDKALSAFYCKYNLDVYLRKCTCCHNKLIKYCQLQSKHVQLIIYLNLYLSNVRLHTFLKPNAIDMIIKTSKIR